MSRSSLTDTIGWLINRLSCMSVAEVVYRVRQLCINKAIKYRVLSITAPVVIHPDNQSPLVMADYSDFQAEAYLQEADAILAGHVALFSTQLFNVGSLPNWNRDPLTGVVAPSTFSLDISITNRALVGDIKYIWELNRHLHWVRLAQAYVISADSRYLYGLAAYINAWLEQCPPLQGVNWTSSLELSIRLINWSFIWQILGGWNGALFQHPSGEQLRTRWLASIFAHCQFINRHFSRYSSANNHLLGELAGLYVAAHAWPYWSDVKQWGTRSKIQLEREAALQYSTDGVNKEQAFAYQLFTLEFLMIAGVEGQCHADQFSDDYWYVVFKALRFLRSIRDVAGHIPNVGDDDDGRVLRLEPGSGRDRVSMILALGEAVFGDLASLPIRDGVKWLLANKDYPPLTQIKEASTDWQFPEGGYFVFGTEFGQPNEIKGLVDCGELGYLGIAAHGHADALAVTLSIAGEACLIDSGTFSYWHDQAWRDYFRGTSAHNTVRVDGVDQSVSGGRFMWTRKAKTTIDQWPTSSAQFDFTGHHEGYQRLHDPVQHQRRVCFDEIQRCLIIRDCVSGNKIHLVEQFWHFGATLTLTLSGNQLRIQGQRFSATLEFVGFKLQIQRFYGDQLLPLAWMSDAYDVKQPINVVKVSVESCAAVIEARLTIE